MRVAFLVDGFNVYHSIKVAQKAARTGLRWLDLQALCSTVVRASLGTHYRLVSVDYFTAIASHLGARDPGKVLRQRTYLAALDATGVRVHTGNFKPKDHARPLSSFSIQVFQRPRKGFRAMIDWIWLRWKSYEEKETDVAIASALFEMLGTNTADAVVIMSGDTDLVPAIRTARRLHPSAEIWVAHPYKRWNKDMEEAVGPSRGVKLSPAIYASSQLPQTVERGSARIAKPRQW
jgi:uncharacterized LabA/DUF88 family protein